MKTVNLTCIGCPLGCSLTAELEGREVFKVTGNHCSVGDKYARKELTNPTRIVTTTVKVTGGSLPVVSVKTASDIPRDRIFDCVAALRSVEVKAPVDIGDIIVPDICGTGTAVVATKNISAL